MRLSQPLPPVSMFVADNRVIKLSSFMLVALCHWIGTFILTEAALEAISERLTARNVNILRDSASSCAIQHNMLFLVLDLSFRTSRGLLTSNSQRSLRCDE